MQDITLTNPVLIFAVILSIILFAPIILHRFKIPDLIGLIVAGTIIGPFGIHLMERDSSIELFGTVGLLYLMFIAGLEIDLADLKKNVWKTSVFGLYTFIIPMVIGTVTSVWILGFTWDTSALLASMYASHTLITYPIVSKYGLMRHRVVSIAVGGTVITCILALLVLAVAVGIHQGDINQSFWIRLGSLSTLSFVIILYVFPKIGVWFFKRYEDSVGQYIFVLAMVFAASYLTEIVGLESIIGAFLAGIALNRLIPNTSPLMNRIEFVGNAIFIPFFLIGVGMLVNVRAFVSGWETLLVSVVMTVIACFTKYLAALLTQKSFKFSKSEGLLLFGLSNSQAAATLAAVMVGYNCIIGTTEDGESIRLLNESVLNGTIVMILFTCTVASFVTQRAAQKVSIDEMRENNDSDIPERILIPLSNTYTVDDLIMLGSAIKSRTNKATMMAVSIVKSEESDSVAEKSASILMEKAEKCASSMDIPIQTILRYDLNVVNGIRNVVKEQKITDIVIGLRTNKELSDTFLGKLTDEVLSKCATTTMCFRPVRPIATVRRYVIFIPEDAEKEAGFPYWLISVWNIGRNLGAKILFCGNQTVLDLLKKVHKKHHIDADFKLFDGWDNMDKIVDIVNSNDTLALVMSKPDYPSYSKYMDKIHVFLNESFPQNNILLIYPLQIDHSINDVSFSSISIINQTSGTSTLNILSQLFKRNR